MTAEWISRVEQSIGRSQRNQPLATAWRWLTASSKKMLTARESRRLRVAESVSLGERRFVVLLQADNEHYLVGASAAGVTLLTRLSGPQPHQAADVPAADQVRCAPEDRSQIGPHNVTTPSADLASVEEPSGSMPRAEGQSLPRAPAEQACKEPTTSGDRAVNAAFPLASSGLRRHAFPMGRALTLLLAFQLLAQVRPIWGQQQGARAATTATTATTPTTDNSPERTASAKTLPSAKNNQSGLSLTGLGGNSAPWTIVVLLTVLTLIPSLMICMTPFARLLVVFHFLRQALGLQTTPSNQTLIGLSLILTFFIMEPLGKQIYSGSVIPLQNGQITALEAVDRGSEPLRRFMAHYVREKDAALFLEIAHAPRPKTIEDVSLRVLMPAYIVSELKAGFQIGAVLFLPFLVVDIVIASITTSVGMMQLPPVVISTPLKLMLFLMVDGWHLLIGALVRSFY